MFVGRSLLQICEHVLSVCIDDSGVYWQPPQINLGRLGKKDSQVSFVGNALLCVHWAVMGVYRYVVCVAPDVVGWS